MNEYARHRGATVRERWSGVHFHICPCAPAHSNTNVDAARWKRTLRQLPRLPILARDVTISLRVRREALVRVVPGQALAGAERDVRQQSAFSQQVPEFDVAARPLA